MIRLFWIACHIDIIITSWATLWAEKWSYTALIFTSSAGSMFLVILAQRWTSSQVNWSVVLALLGMFFCPELLQYVVQKLFPFFCHLGIPKCWLNWSCLHTAGVKSFYTNLTGKRSLSRTKNFTAFYFFVLANVDWRVQLRLCFGKTEQILWVISRPLICFRYFVLVFFCPFREIIWPLSNKTDSLGCHC